VLLAASSPNFDVNAHGSKGASLGLGACGGGRLVAGLLRPRPMFLDVSACGVMLDRLPVQKLPNLITSSEASCLEQRRPHFDYAAL
jgi:hypothetical protein